MVSTAAGHKGTYWAAESELPAWAAGPVPWPAGRHSSECTSAGHKVLALFFEGFVQVNVVTHADSEQVVPVHGECSPQKRVKFKVARSLSQSNTAGCDKLLSLTACLGLT